MLLTSDVFAGGLGAFLTKRCSPPRKGVENLVPDGWILIPGQFLIGSNARVQMCLLEPGKNNALSISAITYHYD